MVYKEFVYYLTRHILKGLVLSIVYFEITKAHDTTPENVLYFLLFYISMICGATLTNIDTNIVTSAFLTKAIFTLVDERIKRKKEE